MGYDPDTGVHSTYSLHYYLVLIVKYRCEVFNEELTSFFRGVVSGFTDNYGGGITNPGADRDLVHLLFEGIPTTDIAKSTQLLKRLSARCIRNEYGDHIEENLWGDPFRTDSYCLISTGQASPDAMKEHGENQRERDIE